jgi:hypothetical protein
MRPKLSVTERLRKYVKQYPTEFQHDGRVLFCELCEKPVSFNSLDYVQHRASKEYSSRLSDPVSTWSGTSFRFATAAKLPVCALSDCLFTDFCSVHFCVMVEHIVLMRYGPGLSDSTLYIHVGLLAIFVLFLRTQLFGVRAATLNC